MKGDNDMKKMMTIQIIAFIVAAGTLSGLFSYTDVYDVVESVIVRVTCLSCLKLDPKTELDFQFKTATDEEHPSFVLNNLSNGPVFLAFRADVCSACDIMEPLVMDIFNVEFGISETHREIVLIDNTEITFYHINIDHAEEEYRKAFEIYDKDNVKGVPMFTMITFGYDHGIVKPSYTTAYGTLNFDTDNERIDLLEKIISDGIYLYEQNIAGHPH